MTVHTPIEARSGGLPPWAIGLTVFVFLVGGVYLASNLVGQNPALAIPGASAPVASGRWRARSGGRRDAHRAGPAIMRHLPWSGSGRTG